MNETSKSKTLREARGDFEKYLQGHGIDIGCGNDLLAIPNGQVDPWDKEQGDMEEMASVKDGSYDFVYASHALEHARSVETALFNWSRILKRNGTMYIVVPDYELYEHMTWPSVFNPDHKCSFSTRLTQKQINRFDKTHYHMTDLYRVLHLCGITIEWTFVEDEGYDYNIGLRNESERDQTLTGALAQICIIGRKVNESAILETHPRSGNKYWKSASGWSR